MDASDRGNVLCWRGWSHTAAYTPQRIARLPAASDKNFCDHLRSTEDICRINCVHRTDVVRLVAISGISVVNWSHKCDQKYSSYEFSAFTCVNLSQPSVTYRNPSVTNPLKIPAWDQFGRREVAGDGKSTYVHHAVGVRNRAIITTKFLGQK